METLGINYHAIGPELVLAVTGVLVMLLEAFSPGKKVRDAVLTAAGIVLAGVVALTLWDEGPMTAFSRMVVVDGFRVFFTLVILFGTLLTIFVSWGFLDEERIPPGEYFALLLFGAVGMTLLVAGNDLVLLFLALETITIATYVLAGYRREDARSTESALKYFILGAFSSAFLLYGIALLYGATRTTNLAEMARVVSGPLGQAETVLLMAGAAMLLIGFGFKVTTVPFHVWTPDVYDGAPTPVTAFLSTAPKAAGFAAFLRVFSITFAPLGIESAADRLASHWVAAVTAMSILSMTFGNFIAIAQTNIKRMLAYSSIAHAGYVLIGVLARDWAAVAFYMLVYTIMNLGCFAIVALWARRGDERVLIADYAGLGFRQPMLSFPLAIFLVSLAGFPGTAGFVAKFWLFKSAWGAGFPELVIIGVLNTVVSVYYYLYVVIVMFFREPKEEVPRVPLPRAFVATMLVALVGVFYLGLLPTRVFAFLNAAQNLLAIGQQ
ncbi:MAG: NADH-quinone oxidoreductase subunit N [Blastocatellia bacterium]|nr:NADH-quinone oxidoreductase subunit N [Blastocatellia bacterium]MCS7158517.1 NADH-quinone oxidoreductase subunit N [Blastocatellia bacterium]MDW8167804.1 NADH-quinone oxidoreductase subunit N [Acidobacteriota bacterium]MDW8257560.1 NADH-quinone oxidoreductase subunit N [Acidobacteriota bacterium]